MAYIEIDGFFLLSTSAVCYSWSDNGGSKVTKDKEQTAEYKQSIGHFFLLRELAGVSGCQVLNNLLQLTASSSDKKPGDFFESGFKNRF